MLNHRTGRSRAYRLNATDPACAAMAIAFSPRPAEGLKYPNIVQMAWARVQATPEGPAFRVKHQGAWRRKTWAEWWAAALAVGARLRNEHGVGKGTFVALVGPNGWEWVVWDLALAMVGAVSVALDPDCAPEAIAKQITATGCSVVIGAAPLLEAGVAGGSTGIPLDLAAVDAEVGASSTGAVSPPWVGQGLGLEDPLTLVFTTGTAGVPTPVVLSHRNFVYVSWAIRNVIPVDEEDEQLLILPLAHTFGRHLLWGAVKQGAVTAIATAQQPLLEAVLELAPTYFVGTPRIFDRIRRQLLTEMLGPNRLARQAFDIALEVGIEVSRYRERAEETPTALGLRGALADRALLSRVRAQFGPRLRFLVSVGGPLRRSTAAFFHGCGILLLEGYGSTETSGAVSVNRIDRFRLGSVGPPLPGCAIRQAEDGEILVRGPNVMMGYHRQPGRTAEAFAEHGWLCTGDLGEIRDGFLWIVGRKADRFTTQTGTEIVPQPIERRLEEAPEIAHAIVGLDAEGQLCALVALHRPEIDSWAAELGVVGVEYADLCEEPRVRRRLEQRLAEVNAERVAHDPIQRLVISRSPFSVASGEISRTGTVQRDKVWRQENLK